MQIQMFSKFIRRFSDRYLSSTIVLALDLLVSVLASLIAILLAKVVSPAGVSVHTALLWLGGSFVFSLIFFLLLRTQHHIIRHSTIRSLGRMALALFGKFMALVVLFFLVRPYGNNYLLFYVALVVDMLLSFSMTVFMRIAMILVYSYVRSLSDKSRSRERVLIYGTGEKSVAVITRLASSGHYRVIGFLTHGDKSNRMRILEHPVYSFHDRHDIVRLKENTGVQSILFANEDDARNEQERLIGYCINNGLKVLITPSIDEVVDGRVMRQNVREIRIEDLLGRDEIEISEREIRKNFHGKTVMVTGAAGSIGSEICRQLAGFGIRKLIMYDNAETPMHNLRLELEERFPLLDFVPIIGDVRLKARLDFAFRTYRPEVVFHAAAYKHVPLMEENPCEAVLVNVAGSRNVADKCIEYGVEKMVMVSTDKAVNPTNIMGCTKRLAEIYVQSLGLAIEQGKSEGRTKFITTRFGNVLGSNGSVIPRFREQIAKGGPVTVTHPDITRFFMTIPEACRLVMEAATMPLSNKIMVFDMGESVRIADLAKRMIELSGRSDVQIVYSGLRPGEKLYEEVLSNTENTEPTEHERIRIAKVREYDYHEAREFADRLETLSRAVDIPDMVRLMKRTVPEFKSKNSQYEIYDK